MLAYKTQLSITDDFIYFKIPRNFKGKKVEIIVLETDDTSDDTALELVGVENFYENYRIGEEKDHSETKQPNKFQKLLLSAPVWSDEQYNNFIETRKSFNQWTID